MADSKLFIGWFFGFFVGAFLAIIIMMFLTDAQVDDFRKQAVLRGAAEYKSSENGDVAWHWKSDAK